MIDPKELRLGNWVIKNARNQIDPTHRYIEVNHLDMGSVNGDASISGMEGIVITREIMEKCGFTLVDQGGQDQGLYHPKLIFGIYSSANGYHLVTDEGTDITMPGRLAFLHQLQNLFFTLTGDELDVQL